MITEYHEAPAADLVRIPEPWKSAAVTVVLPTYQEAANIPAITEAIFNLPLTNLRVIVVDDNSPDGTGRIADELAVKYGQDRMSVVHRKDKEGLGRAYVDGMTRAIEGGAEFVAQMDCDLSHRPEHLPEMIGTILSTSADVVIGSRYIACASVGAEWPWHRKTLSAFANLYVRGMLGMNIRDVTAGYKLWRASALQTIGLPRIHSAGYSFQVEMSYLAIKNNLRAIELPIHFRDRQQGESKMSLAVQLESALMPFKLRRRVR
jgi:dolichol-phosphate mannosyltransferase